MGTARNCDGSTARNQLSPGQLWRLCRDFFSTDEKAVTFAAVMLAESGGFVDRIGDCNNPRAGCHSFGLGQVNYCPERDKGSRPEPAVLLTARGNAQFCHQLSNDGDPANLRRHWTVYRTGAYLKFEQVVRKEALLPGSGATLPGAEGRDAGGPGVQGALDKAHGTGSEAVVAAKSAINTVGDFLAALTRRETLIRALEIVGGFIAIIAGALLLARDQLGQAAGSLAAPVLAAAA